MSLKPHIGIFGKRNVGKSSFINAIAQQDISIVSPQAGTTTDPVKKLIEIEGVGPTLFIDTAGVDDTGDLGAKRVEKTLHTIEEINLGIILITSNKISSYEKDIILKLKKNSTPFFLVHHKNDEFELISSFKEKIKSEFNIELIPFSSIKHEKKERDYLVKKIEKLLPKTCLNIPTILGDLVKPKDVILMVTPIDSEAPQGRMILPQMQALRDALDHDCIVIMLKETELKSYFEKVGFSPSLVITDSQVFEFVNSIVPKEIPLTGFSILFARMKGDFNYYMKGTPEISNLRSGDKVLIYESCSHHQLEDDIGREKIPKWIRSFTKQDIEFEVVAGKDHPRNPLKEYCLVIQCGGCMMTGKQIENRMLTFIDEGIPITNYGLAIAYCHGIFNRATALFADLS